MHNTLFNFCGVSIMTMAFSFSILATPVMARGGGGGIRVSGGGGFHGGGGGDGYHGGGGGFHGGGGSAWHGGYGGEGGGYANGYVYGGAALGLGLLSGAIIDSQYPYYDSGYENAPQDADSMSTTSCASRFKSYDPASGTYLGYDGLRHPCP
jgi:hypothetical protein